MTQESTPPMPRRKGASAYRGQPANDPFIFTRKTVYMQRLGDAVRAGALHYISGTIPLAKVPFLVKKFAARYRINLGKIADHRARHAGEDVARWLGWYDEKTALVHWALFYFPGKTICREERWLNPFDARIRLTGYELVRITKKGAKAPVITWKYTREQYRWLHDQIVFSIRGRQDAVLDQLIFSLSKSPGFAGVREQVKGLWSIVKAEWKRVRSKHEPPPKIPPTLGYVRRLPDVGMPWSQLMKASKKGTKDEQETHEKPLAKRTRKARSDTLLLQPSTSSAAEEG
ncbi:MAG: hypothetical protein U7M05_11635 [Candidatus Igneacidithiobacillus chanchocoensis]